MHKLHSVLGWLCMPVLTLLPILSSSLITELVLHQNKNISKLHYLMNKFVTGFSASAVQKLVIAPKTVQTDPFRK